MIIQLRDLLPKAIQEAENRKHTVHWTDLNGKVHTRIVKADSGQAALDQFKGFQPTGKVQTGGKTGKVKKVTSGEGVMHEDGVERVGDYYRATAKDGSTRMIHIPTNKSAKRDADRFGNSKGLTKKPGYKTPRLPEAVDTRGWSKQAKDDYYFNLKSRQMARDRENAVRAKNGHPPLKTHNPNPSRPLPGEDVKKEYVSGSAGGGVTKSPSPRLRSSFFDKKKMNTEPAKQWTPEEIAAYISKQQKPKTDELKKSTNLRLAAHWDGLAQNELPNETGKDAARRTAAHMFAHNTKDSRERAIKRGESPPPIERRTHKDFTVDDDGKVIECSSATSAMVQGSPDAEIRTPKAFARKKHNQQ